MIIHNFPRGWKYLFFRYYLLPTPGLTIPKNLCYPPGWSYSLPSLCKATGIMQNVIRTWIVEDDPMWRESLVETLSGKPHIEVVRLFSTKQDVPDVLRGEGRVALSGGYAAIVVAVITAAATIIAAYITANSKKSSESSSSTSSSGPVYTTICTDCTVINTTYGN